jgi:hypothetical protein
VQTPRGDRHDPPDRKPSRAKEAGGAAQRMANLDGRSEHGSAMLQEKGQVGGHRRSKCEDQSEDHKKRLAESTP